jgi:tRNA A37 threonylcarbamoyltransferase TsaD
MMGLGYPAAWSSTGWRRTATGRYPFPRARIAADSADFSFSG